jgi:hypothetical protein
MRDSSCICLSDRPRLLRAISGYGITGSPVIADMNGDVLLECALSSNAYWMYSTDIYVWNLGVPCHADCMDWPMFRRDPEMTACWQRAQAGIEEGREPQAASYRCPRSAAPAGEHKPGHKPAGRERQEGPDAQCSSERRERPRARRLLCERQVSGRRL